MNGLRVQVAGQVVEPDVGWEVRWLDRARGIMRLSNGARSVTALVEGQGSDWAVTLAGRRIQVTVQTWREQMLAEGEGEAVARGGPGEVGATLPGLVVAIAVEEGSEVEAGQALLTIEAMKMQNEVRASRAGTVAAVAVEPGEAVATGALLLRLE
jgi:biotin carboxyl carrier protein